METNLYDGRQARYELADALSIELETMTGYILDARSMEMTFASNEMVNPFDFDLLLQKTRELRTMILNLRGDKK